MIMAIDFLFISIQKNLDTIGLKYLHYNLLAASYRSTILYCPEIEAATGENWEEIFAFIRQRTPTTICFSLMSTEFLRVSKLSEAIKREFPDITLGWGGIHPTIAPEMCLEFADYVCIGECDQAIIDIAAAFETGGFDAVKKVNNVCFRSGGKIQKNPLNPLVTDLDSLPPYEHIPVHSFLFSRGTIRPVVWSNFRQYAPYRGNTYSVITTRGCPFSCTYCCNNFLTTLYGSKKIRKRSIDKIIEELSKAVSDYPNLEYINFQDDCFLACSNDYLEEFCQRYKAVIGKPFIIRSIPIYITPEKITALKDAGLGWISLGLQSGSDRVAREVYKRKSYQANFLKAARIIHQSKVAAYYDVILDNPYETEADMLETIHTLLETPRPFYTQFFSLTFYLGTELYDRAALERGGEFTDSLEKNYLSYEKNTINEITRLATFLPLWQMKAIVSLYKRQTAAGFLKILLFVAKLQTALFFEPLMYLRVIRLSVRGDLFKTMTVLPSYLKEGLSRYFEQFKK